MGLKMEKDALALIKTRRSIRKYSEKQVPDEIVEKVIEAGIWAPSSNHSEPAEFIIIKNEKTKEALSKISSWSGFLKKAPVNIAVIAKNSGCLIEDSSAAIMNMMIEAHSLGLGTCWIDCQNSQKIIKKILEIPEDYTAITVLPLGYPDENPSSKRKAIKEKVHLEKYA